MHLNSYCTLSEKFSIHSRIMSAEIDFNESEKSESEIINLIDELERKVDNLYYERDYYFEKFPVEEAKNKLDYVQEKLDELLKEFEEVDESILTGQNKARYLYVKGKAYNVSQNFSENALNAVSKAVKLNPKLVSAWNELGECHWKMNNVREAKSSFEGALQHERNKITLRNLSIVLRREYADVDSDKHIANVKKSVELGKEAVSLDIKDGVSWFLLGNAYLCSFFTVAQDPGTLKLCMSAYRQAEADPVVKGMADHHLNKGVAQKYEEDYAEALKSYSQSYILDPLWDHPLLEKNKLVTFLGLLNDMIKTKGKQKGKKLQQMMEQIVPQKLGPYAKGPGGNGKPASRLDYVFFDDLVPERNLEKVVLGKVVGSLHSDNMVPFTFVMVDAKGTCVGVNVYNWAGGKGVIIGDSVAIPEPELTEHHIVFEDKEFQFKTIRVDNPMVMVVNGKKIGKEQIACVRVTTLYKSD